MMQLAFYKGTPSNFIHKVTHVLICLFTGSKYSHVELVVNGHCYSASTRDKGVRMKMIYLDSGKWDVIPLNPIHPNIEVRALKWFSEHMGQSYDWAGVFRFIVPFIPHRKNEWFCSEAVAEALGLYNSNEYSPGQLARHYGLEK